MKEVRIQNWNQLNDQVFLDSWFLPHGRFRGPFVYRGMTNATWDLQTSLMRLGGRFDEVEGSLLRNFQKYGHRNRDSGDSFWHWLAVAQHHGLPTRLLDWTYSPHVAAHFATDELEQSTADGVIWQVDFIKVHQRLPAGLQRILNRERAVAFTTAMLDSYCDSLASFDKRFGKGRQTAGALFLEPPSLDDRIVNQAAFLSVMSTVTARLDHWFRDVASDLCRKIIIPASVKLEIRDKLDMMNITERMIYGGLDGLSKWLKRYYSPLNIIQITYPEGTLARDATRVALVVNAKDGHLKVKLFTKDGTCDRETTIHSGDDGLWYDDCENCPVTVKSRPNPEATPAAIAHLRGLTRSPKTDRRVAIRQRGKKA